MTTCVDTKAAKCRQSSGPYTLIWRPGSSFVNARPRSSTTLRASPKGAAICQSFGAKQEKKGDLKDVTARRRPPILPNGVLASIASRVLMKVLQASRVAPHDLPRAVNALVRWVTKWGVFL